MSSDVTQNGHGIYQQEPQIEDDIQMSKAIIKEGILEKKGHSTAFFTWPK